MDASRLLDAMPRVRASAERASSFASGRVPDDVRLKAERAGAAIASTGFQVAHELSEVFSEAREAALKEAAAVNEEWRSVLRVTRPAPQRANAEELGSLLDYCAQPFAHGHAVAPEIDRLQATVDGCDDDALLRRAHQRLHELDLELPAPLVELSPPLLPPDVGSSAAAATAQEVLAREPQHDATREADERATRERLAAQRDGFLAGLQAQAPSPASSSSLT